MENAYWSTDYYIETNSETMQDFLNNVNMLDITLVDGSYAEGINGRGEKYAIHVCGNGSAYYHKATYTLINEG